MPEGCTPRNSSKVAHTTDELKAFLGEDYFYSFQLPLPNFKKGNAIYG